MLGAAFSAAIDVSPPLVVALCDPDLTPDFAGTPVVIAAGGFDAGLVADMVDDGRTVWDVCSTDFANGVALARAGLLEPLDPAILGRQPGPFASSGPAPWWGATAAVTTLVLACDGHAPHAPGGWAAFYDGAGFPGQRAMPADLVVGVLESALLGDGVPPASLYPLDAERAFARLNRLRPQMVFWRDGRHARALMNAGVAAGLLFSHTLAGWPAAGRFAAADAPGFALRLLWVVPKGNPAGPAAATRLIAAVATNHTPDRTPAPRGVITADEDWYVENAAWLLARWHELVRG